MEQKSEFKNRLGMFDLLKALAFLLIMLGHYRAKISSYYPGNAVAPLLEALHIKIGVLMPLFFMMSGYYFKPTDMKKCVRKQADLLLKPYAIFAVIITVLVAAAGFASGGADEAWALAREKILAFIFCVTENRSIFGLPASYIGTIWFLPALFNAWVVLNFIFKYQDERTRACLVSASVIIGLLLGRLEFVPFLLPQTFTAVGFLAAGYLLNKEQFFAQKYSAWTWVIIAAVGIGSFIYGGSSMYRNYWRLGLLDVAGSIFESICILKLYFMVPVRENKLTGYLSHLGRGTLWLMGMHTIEQGLGWVRYVKAILRPVIKLPDNMFFDIALQFVLSLLLLTIGLYAIEWYTRQKHIKKAQKRKASRAST